MVPAALQPGTTSALYAPAPLLSESASIQPASQVGASLVMGAQLSQVGAPVAMNPQPSQVGTPLVMGAQLSQVGAKYAMCA